MDKATWIKEANTYLVSITGEWENGLSESYCDSLYETYVEDMRDDPFSPEDAIEEDMNYWED